MAPLARAVRAAGIKGIDRRGAPHLINPSDFFQESDLVRRLFSRLVNISDPDRVAIIPSVSYGLATVARNAPVRQGDNIVITEEQFPSNVYTWHRLSADRGLRLNVVPAPNSIDSDRATTWNTRLLAAINNRTALVALPQAHWTDGTLFDLEQVGQRARECNALLIVDGTQSVGALPFDIERVRPDALVCAAYKWLLGPYSIGLAYFGPAFDQGIPLEENWIARRGSEAFADLIHYRDEYQPAAIRYDVGERSNFTLLPMLVAALQLILEWTAPAIQDYCRSLTSDLISTLRGRGYWIEEDRWRASHLFGVRLRNPVDAVRLADRLHARRVVISLRGNAIRISPHLYNNAADTEALLDVLD